MTEAGAVEEAEAAVAAAVAEMAVAREPKQPLSLRRGKQLPMTGKKSSKLMTMPRFFNLSSRLCRHKTSCHLLSS